MLILSRKQNETLVIRHDVRIKVLSVQGNQVKIGIDAPREVRILRDELIERDKNSGNAPEGEG